MLSRFSAILKQHHAVSEKATRSRSKMVWLLGNRRQGVVVVLIALSACVGSVQATTTTVDPEDLWPDCDEDMDFYGDGYCDRATLNTEECGFDGGEFTGCGTSSQPSILWCGNVLRVVYERTARFYKSNRFQQKDVGGQRGRKVSSLSHSQVNTSAVVKAVRCGATLSSPGLR